jgi:biopolymer transport protein ExbD
MNELIIKVARDAGMLLMEKFESGVRVEFKGKYDLVTEADHASEALIVADATTPYRLLIEVLYTLGQSEFGKYHLMVMKRSAGTKG